MSDLGDLPQEASSPREGVGARAKRLLRDSSRFLISNLRAALAEPDELRRHILEGWREGHRQPEREAAALTDVLRRSLTEVTAHATERRVDLLLEGAPGSERTVQEPTRLGAVLGTALKEAVDCCEPHGSVSITLLDEDPYGALLLRWTCRGESRRDDLALALDNPGSQLGLAREVAQGWGGGLFLLPREQGGGLRLALPPARD